MEEGGNCEVHPDFMPLKRKRDIDRSPSANTSLQVCV